MLYSLVILATVGLWLGLLNVKLCMHRSVLVQ
jgi:hypothetical protein